MRGKFLAKRHRKKTPEKSRPYWDDVLLVATPYRPDVTFRYRFQTIKPGAYPWGNHFNAWRPAHIHFSLFGNAFAQRLVTQMYFPGDPLLPYDPMVTGTPEKYRNRLIADFALSVQSGLRADGAPHDQAQRPSRPPTTGDAPETPRPV